MALEGDLQTLLASLATGGAYAVEAPEGVSRPYIVYQFISDIAEYSIDDTAGPGWQRLQITIWGETYASVRSGRLLIIAAMAASTTITNVPVNRGTDTKDPETKLFGVMMDYSVWSE